MELEQMLRIAKLEKYPEFFGERNRFARESDLFYPHPKQALIEAIFSNFSDLEVRFGEVHAAFLYGYVRGHIGQCSPCEGAVKNEIFKHPGEVF